MYICDTYLVDVQSFAVVTYFTLLFSRFGSTGLQDKCNEENFGRLYSYVEEYKEMYPDHSKYHIMLGGTLFHGKNVFLKYLLLHALSLEIKSLIGSQ